MVYTLIKDGIGFPVIFHNNKELPETILDKEGKPQTYDCLFIDRKYFVVREEIKDKFIECSLKQGILKVE